MKIIDFTGWNSAIKTIWLLDKKYSIIVDYNGLLFSKRNENSNIEFHWPWIKFKNEPGNVRLHFNLNSSLSFVFERGYRLGTAKLLGFGISIKQYVKIKY